ncbi:hypothetical protein [Mycobacterium sp. 4858]|uniref:hypothetical protein n=1 Tax=Mycobacterium sp. 4858 TaxID=2057185 RepID=UPI000C84BD6D|nr:hypothetical protein [Mycobacterium sp. 4858]
MSTTDRALTQFSFFERAQHYWIRHRCVDWLIGVAAVGIWIGLGKAGWIPHALTDIPHDTRRALYQILGTVAATMGGFTLTSVSILVNLLRTPLTTVDRLLPAEDKRRVGAVFLSVLPALLLLFVGALVAIATDANLDRGYWWMQLVMVGLAVAAIMSIGRVVWVLGRLLALSSDA